MSTEIAATDGVDVVFVGPGDLSVSIDAMGPAGADRLGQAIGTIIAAALAHGKIAGIFCAKPEDAGQMGRARAPASSSWPATRCSSAPASRQAMLLPAASFAASGPA